MIQRNLWKEGANYPMRLRVTQLFVFALAMSLLTLAAQAQGKQKSQKKPAPKDPQDTIEVVGHLPSVNGAVARFLTTERLSSYYLYAERDGGKSVTLIDITDASRPVVVAD